MKSFILMWLVLLTSTSAALCAANARGLVVYTEPPNTYVETREFVSIANTNSVIATAVLLNGKKEEILRGGIIAIIQYPPSTQTESLPQEAATAIRTIQTLRPKYPQFAGKLDAVQTKWDNSLEFYRQRQRMARVTPPAATPTLALTVDGIIYTQVILVSFDGATVGIEHSAGAATLPAIKIKPEQIAALNATSTIVRIDPNKIVAELPKASPTPRLATADGPVKLPFKAVPGVPLTKAQQAANDAVLAEAEKANEASQIKGAESAKQKIQSLLSDKEVPWPRGLDFADTHPDYQETLAFINGKIKAAGQRMWFGERTGEMILQSPDYVDTFDPKSLSTTVKMGHGSDGLPFVQAECAEGRRDVFSIWAWGRSGQAPGIRLHCTDEVDVKRVAEAMVHLIEMFGGKAEAF